MERFTVIVVTAKDFKGLTHQQAVRFIESLGKESYIRKLGQTYMVIPKGR